ncbi:FeoA family protein [Pelolinea submarina]|uniref:Ferrous iron transport protein A n=1 Tax=Pelolinea submarina TaxID=913107 RepID=A0A3E0AK78_9CHLR|nr:FeoA family protein [Pelolinea submarina]REG10310.1 ferrous iron transport protein A [Pelolinea submarina]
MINLLQVNNGNWVKVIKVAGGIEMERRLAQLGFLPGNKVRIIRSAPFHGPLLLDVEGREIVLGRGVANKVMVEYLS